MQKVKSILGIVLMFLFILILCIIPILAFLSAMKALDLLYSKHLFFLLLIGFSTVISAVMTNRIVHSSNLAGTSNSPKWFRKNSYNLYVAYILFVVACFSVKENIIFDSNTINNFIVIQWMIFTISVAILIAYWSLVKPYLIESQPTEGNGKGLKRLSYLQEKEYFYHKIRDSLFPIKLLTINLFVLIIATSATCFVIGLNIYTQAVTISSFYLSTNSLCTIFLKITMTIEDEIKTMLQENEVSDRDKTLTMAKAILEEIDFQVSKKNSSIGKESNITESSDIDAN